MQQSEGWIAHERTDRPTTTNRSDGDSPVGSGESVGRHVAVEGSGPVEGQLSEINNSTWSLNLSESSITDKSEPGQQK
jgi:hypothetical protein